MTSIVANGDTDTVYIEQAGSLYYYSINTGALIALTSFPITIQNTAIFSSIPIII
jgi:hypothetical protein